MFILRVRQNVYSDLKYEAPIIFVTPKFIIFLNMLFNYTLKDFHFGIVSIHIIKHNILEKLTHIYYK